MTTATVTRRLQSEGLPVTLNRGPGYHYFVFDDGTNFETETVVVYRFRDVPLTRWLDDGRAFAARAQALIAERAARTEAGPFKFKLTGKAR